MSESYLPCPELLAILRPAFMPCRHFQGACSSCAQWQPKSGYVPRGFIGAFGRLDEIKLVLLVAEPGNPQQDENYPDGPNPDAILNVVCKFVFKQFENGRDLFHRNIRKILELCWPNLSLREQLTRTWITESYLCSAPNEGGSVPSVATKACANLFLAPQLFLLQNCPVVALGGKARRRAGEFPGVISAAAVAPPGCNRSEARKSWDSIPALLKSQTIVGSIPIASELSTAKNEVKPVAKLKSISTKEISNDIRCDLFKLIVEEWNRLGGTIEEKKGLGICYFKLMHTVCDSNRACVVVNLDKRKAFEFFANVRIRNLEQWDEIYSAVASRFDPYLLADRGIKESGRQGRIECLPKTGAWQITRPFLDKRVWSTSNVASDRLATGRDLADKASPRCPLVARTVQYPSRVY